MWRIIRPQDEFPKHGKLIQRNRETQLKTFLSQECLQPGGSYYGVGGGERFEEDYVIEDTTPEGEWSVLIWDPPPEENEFGRVSP